MKFISIILIIFTFISCGGNVDNLTVGDKAPNFTLEDNFGNSYTLSDYQDKNPVVIYFYPKANTSGCTKQACGVRDDYAQFEENEIKIFGISVDQKKEITDFVNNYSLNFPLLADSDKKISEKYGVLNSIGIANRITFIVDKEGNLANIIKDVNVDTHSANVLELAKQLQ